MPPDQAIPSPSMDRLLTNESNQLICIRQGECTGRSIVKALDNFLSAVQTMKETVMVPTRLRDMSAPFSDVNKVHLPEGAGAVAVHLASRSELSLYSFYRMLQMIRNELVSGPTSDDSERFKTDDDGANDEAVVHLSTVFQQHLQGLFTILHQLTDAANYLTKRYQEDLNTNLLPPPF